MRFALKLIFSDREEFYQKLHHFFLQLPNIWLDTKVLLVTPDRQ
jgi:hypothetical protein